VTKCVCKTISILILKVKVKFCFVFNWALGMTRNNTNMKYKLLGIIYKILFYGVFLQKKSRCCLQDSFSLCLFCFIKIFHMILI
jgi:hypothetical protein